MKTLYTARLKANAITIPLMALSLLTASQIIISQKVNAGTLDGATSATNNNVAIGQGSESTGTNSTSVGENSFATSSSTAAFGTASQATGTNATALGAAAYAEQSNTTATGTLAQALGVNTTALGANAMAESDNSVAIGNNALSVANNAIALGNNTYADEENTVSVGNSASGETRRLTNVAAAVNGTDAVNLNQLHQELDSISSNLRDEMAAGVASAAAFNPATPSKPGKTAVGVGAATYRGEQAIAISINHRLKNSFNQTQISGGIAYDSQNETLGKVGVSWEF